MARIIEMNIPGIRSFVFLTPEEALREFGGSIAFVGKSSKPTETPSIDLPTNPHSQKKTQKNRRKSK
jgi:ABC-type molybdate transport system permease subunit